MTSDSAGNRIASEVEMAMSKVICIIEKQKKSSSEQTQKVRNRQKIRTQRPIFLSNILAWSVSRQFDEF
jgi:hypothetical protein